MPEAFDVFKSFSSRFLYYYVQMELNNLRDINKWRLCYSDVLSQRDFR